jgi:CheY-like chemotaxis protein
MYPEFNLGDAEWKAFVEDREGAIVGAGTAKQFGWKVGDRIPLIGSRLAEPRACLLLDMTLVGITAQELLARLREREMVLPVIAVSVRDDVLVRRSARELGAMLFLQKPVDDQALLDAIEWATGPS